MDSQAPQSLCLASLARDMSHTGMQQSKGPNWYTETSGRTVREEHRPHRNSLLRILRYADAYDRFLMAVGSLGAIGDGISVPFMIVILSSLINVFGNGVGGQPDVFMQNIIKYTMFYIYLGIVVGALSYIEAWAWIMTGERQCARLRCLYLKAILRQDDAYFDVQGTNTADVVNSVAADTDSIQEVLSEKVPYFVMNASTFVGGFALGFHLNTRLAAICLAFIPLLVIPGLVYGKILSTLARKAQSQYSKAGIIAEQALSSIRTVYAFAGEEKTLKGYSRTLAVTMQIDVAQGLAKGLAVGSTGVVFAIWAFLAWYGSKLVFNGGANAGMVIGCGLAAIRGGLSLGNSLPALKYFMEAGLAAARICDMIERIPDIDIENDTGSVLLPEQVRGNFELNHVSFAYPARPEKAVFTDFTLHIPACKTTALVGGSGSGKSTIIALLLRLYDPIDGIISLDGTPITQLQLKSLRAQMGLVSQEPALFATSVKDNIALGKEGATMVDIVQAAVKANAHEFISKLPDGYDTQVGEHGVQMSGGQKQRIAIARAILKNAPILLLDEATSALDAESERLVQDALDHAALDRTTVVVAHRLSTIRNADLVAVLQGGQVVEKGEPNDLLCKGGAYKALVDAASLGSDCKKIPSTSHKSTVSSSEIFDPSFPLEKSALGNKSDADCSEKTAMSNQKTEGDRSLPNDSTDSSPPSLKRLLSANKPEWQQGVMGALGACMFGIIHPLYAFTLGSVISAFYVTDTAKQQHLIRNYSLLFFALAVASFVTNVVQHYSFGVMGARLTRRVRETMLAKILSFEVGWFDKPENSSGAVCGRLATDASLVRALVGDRWSLITTTVVAAIAAAIFGLAISWRLAVVIIVVQPLVIACVYGRKVLIQSMSAKALITQERSSHLAAEAVSQHRVIAAFSSHNEILRLFGQLQEESRTATARQALLGGVGMGGAQLITAFSWALDFWYGGRLVSQGVLTLGEMFKTFLVLVSTGRIIAEAGSMTSEIAKGSAAVASVFKTLDRASLIDSEDSQAEEVDKVVGNVDLRHVNFAYPARPEVVVFGDFSLSVGAGESVALVGQSGSGKSTVIALILRFYDPLKGTVMVDGRDVRKLHLRHLRQQIGLVGQEPILFAGSIRDNIVYGTSRTITEDEIVQAATAANAHDFICSLPNGYETNVGDRGVQLSGGQKQRIAIARAIVKKPAILLLDEATSALDAQSEKTVQEALERVMEGRTTIVVAHRLSTIRTCNTICVLERGRMVESGSHSELLSKGPSGAYFNLVRLQQSMPLP